MDPQLKYSLSMKYKHMGNAPVLGKLSFRFNTFFFKWMGINDESNTQNSLK